MLAARDPHPASPRGLASLLGAAAAAAMPDPEGHPARDGGAACDDRPMTRPADRMPNSTLRTDSGLVWPRSGSGSWLGDAHAVAALVAALPVWLALGLGLGERMQAPSGWAAWLTFVLLRPVIEEIVFRGVLQGQLLRLGSRRIGPVTLANLAATLVFIGWHVPAQPLAWALAVAVPSLVFGHLRERFGSVLPAVIVHIVYNAGFGLTAWWVRS
jgi:uncharacterized protein